LAKGKRLVLFSLSLASLAVRALGDSTVLIFQEQRVSAQV